MLHIYNADEVHAALPWRALVERLDRAFAQGADVPVRHAHRLGGSDALLLMPAWSDTALGVKLVTVMPGNPARGVATVQATYLLLDRGTGEARALLDGEALTLRRTAAASALAARYLARPDARCLLVVGTGHLARWMARAHCALRPQLDRVLVWGRNPQAATRENAKLRGNHIRSANAQLQPLVETSRQTMLGERKQLADKLRINTILSSREYAFCLYPSAELQALMQTGTGDE